MLQLRLLRWFCCAVLATLAAACDFDKTSSFTVATGTVTDRYTGQPVANAAVTLIHQLSAPFTGARISPADTAYTDAAGQYHLAFEAGSKCSYFVYVYGTKDFYTLPYSPNAPGSEAQRGVTNHLDFEVMPYKTVTITANSSKNGKSAIEFFFIAWGQEGNDFRGSIVSDTVRATPRVAFSSTVKVLPNRHYRFVKQTYNRVWVSNTRVEVRDEVWENQYRTVLNNDTTTITFR